MKQDITALYILGSTALIVALVSSCILSHKIAQTAFSAKRERLTNEHECLQRVDRVYSNMTYMAKVLKAHHDVLIKSGIAKVPPQYGD